MWFVRVSLWSSKVLSEGQYLVQQVWSEGSRFNVLSEKLVTLIVHIVTTKNNLSVGLKYKWNVKNFSQPWQTALQIDQPQSSGSNKMALAVSGFLFENCLSSTWKCGLLKENLPCIQLKCQSLVTIIHRYHCDITLINLMMGTNIDIKAISRKVQRLILRNDFTGWTNVEKLVSQRFCCFPVVALKPSLTHNMTSVEVVIP